MAVRMRHLAGAMLVAMLLAGCAPTPAPTPSPTGFASEEEAFAAAEATYRAYVDAVSDAQSGSPGVAPATLLTGQALEDEIASNRELAADGSTLSGPVTVTNVTQIMSSSATATIQACLDLSKSRVISSSGEDVTPTARPDAFSVEVEALWTPTGTLISSSKPSSIPC